MIHEGEAPWADRPNRISLHASSSCPSPQTSSSAFLLARAGLVLVQVRKRGWDLPGGHVEAGEDALTSLVREVWEEAGLVLPAEAFKLAGYAHLHVLAPKPANYAYPYPHTFQPIYMARVEDELVEKLATNVPDEVGEVRIFSYEEVMKMSLARTWLPLYTHLLATDFFKN